MLLNTVIHFAVILPVVWMELLNVDNIFSVKLVSVNHGMEMKTALFRLYTVCVVHDV